MFCWTSLSYIQVVLCNSSSYSHLSLFVCRGRRYALQEWQAFYYYYYYYSHLVLGYLLHLSWSSYDYDCIICLNIVSNGNSDIVFLYILLLQRYENIGDLHFYSDISHSYIFSKLYLCLLGHTLLLFVFRGTERPSSPSSRSPILRLEAHISFYHAGILRLLASDRGGLLALMFFTFWFYLVWFHLTLWFYI